MTPVLSASRYAEHLNRRPSSYAIRCGSVRDWPFLTA